MLLQEPAALCGSDSSWVLPNPQAARSDATHVPSNPNVILPPAAAHQPASRTGAYTSPAISSMGWQICGSTAAGDGRGSSSMPSSLLLPHQVPCRGVADSRQQQPHHPASRHRLAASSSGGFGEMTGSEGRSSGDPTGVMGGRAPAPRGVLDLRSSEPEQVCHRLPDNGSRI